MKIEVMASAWVTALKAVTPHCSTDKKVSDALHAVLVRVDSGAVTLTATNRYSLISYTLPEVVSAPDDGEFLLNKADALAFAKAATFTGPLARTDVLIEASDTTVEMNALGVVLRVPTTDGQFPAVNRLWESFRAGEADRISFAPSQLELWVKTARAIDAKRPGALVFEIGGQGVATRIKGEHFIGLQMPVRPA